MTLPDYLDALNSGRLQIPPELQNSDPGLRLLAGLQALRRLGAKVPASPMVLMAKASDIMVPKGESRAQVPAAEPAPW